MEAHACDRCTWDTMSCGICFPSSAKNEKSERWPRRLATNLQAAHLGVRRGWQANEGANIGLYVMTGTVTVTEDTRDTRHLDTSELAGFRV